MIQEETDMSRMSVEFIVNTESSVSHAANAFPVKDINRLSQA